MTSPFILGVTGSIGMGKTTVAQMFAKLGVPVFDADGEVHRLQGPKGALLPAIEAEFPGTTGPEGVKREQLGALVFADETALARLEALVHPPVDAARSAFPIKHGGAPLIVFDIPLLFEKGSRHRVDAIAVVSAPASMQRERVLCRPGMTEEKFAQILSQQMPASEKRALADYVIDTSTSLEQTEAAVAKIADSLIAQAKDRA